MIWQTNFKDLHHYAEIRHEILSISKGLDVIVNKVHAKNWIYATLDDNQIFDEDAQNLSLALRELGVSSVYSCWVANIEDKEDFDVIAFNNDKQSIENSQCPNLCLLEADDSYIFNDGELKLLVIRPVGNRFPLPYTLIMAGSKSFIEMACCADGWVIHDST